MAVQTQWRHPRVYLWAKESIALKMDVSEDVIAFQCSKGLTDSRGFYGPAGTFSVTLMPRTSVATRGSSGMLEPTHAYKLAQPQSVISIGYDQDGGVMLGLVDAVEESFLFEGPQVGRTVTIRGRDMGKSLEMDNIFRAPVNEGDVPQFVADLKAELGEDFPFINDGLELYETDDDKHISFMLQSLQDIVDWILDRMPGMQIPILAQAFGRDQDGDTDRIRTWLDTSRCILSWDDERVYSDMAVTPQGSIINFIQSFLDPDFYELWVDSKPIEGSPIPQPFLMLRPRPFDDEPYIVSVGEYPGIGWANITNLVDGADRHEIGIGECKSANFSRSDAEVISVYQVTSANELGSGDDSLKQGLAFPLVDTWALNRFGCRAYTPSISLVSGDPTFTAMRGRGDFLNATIPRLIEKRNRLFNWYRLNPFYERAQITVHGKDSYRIGEKVFLPWRQDVYTGTAGMEYYCTGVQHQFQTGVGYSCSLTLERGHNSAMVVDRMQYIRQQSRPYVPNGYTKVDR